MIHGGINDSNLGNNIVKNGHTIVPAQPYDKMPSVLQKYEYMIISRRLPKTTTLPNGKESFLEDEKGKRLYTYMNEGFGRIIPEALNCGVKVLVDKDSKRCIGAYSYGWSDGEIVDNCDEADILFFDMLKERGLLK